MRRLKPRGDWYEGSEPLADGAFRPGRTGQIVAAAEHELPELEPLHRVRSIPDEGWSGASDRTARITGDLEDGSPVYPAAPQRIPGGTPLQRLLLRVSLPVWPFVALAVVQSATLLVDAWVTAGWSLGSVAGLLIRLLYTGAIALLPAAVLVWRPDAWRETRLVLLGAMLWTTLPSAVATAWWWVLRSPDLFAAIGLPLALLVTATSIASYLGPAAVAFGLDRMRHAPTAAPGTRGVLVCILVTIANGTRWVSPTTPGTIPIAPPVVLDARHLPGLIGACALPVEVLCLAVLTYACVSALLAGEVRTRFWQCATAGSALLTAVALFQFLTGDLLAPEALAGLSVRSWDATEGVLLPMIGAGLMFLAFTSPVWSKSRDAAWRRSAPDDVFAWGDAAQAAEFEKVPMGRVVAVAAGADHSLAVDERGNVAAWGNDYAGQIDVPNGLTGVAAVAAGDAFSVALRFDGTVVAWGANDAGQTAVPEDLTDVVAIAARGKFALALKRDGTIAGWGAGPGILPVPEGLTGVTAISAGERHCIALRRNGTVVAWGDDAAGQTEVPAGLSDVIAISAGGFFNLALCADRTVVAWGDNSYGQLDVPDTLRNVVAISAGAFHALALRADGDIVGWGGGGQRIGEAIRPWRLVDFRAVAAGDGFSLAIRAA